MSINGNILKMSPFGPPYHFGTTKNWRHLWSPQNVPLQIDYFIQKVIVLKKIINIA